MRILLIHSFYRPGMPSGENDVVVNQFDLLRSRGYEVELWGPTSPEDASSLDKLRIGVRIASGHGEDPAPFIRDYKPDLVHVHNLFPNISLGWLATCEPPVAMTIHNYRVVCANGVMIRESRPCTDCLTGSSVSGFVHGCYRGSRAATLPVLGFQRHLRAAIRRGVGTLIFNSEVTQEILAQQLAHPSSIVLPNFVAEVRPRESSAGGNHRPYFLVLGRLTPEKGVDRLLGMWPQNRRLVIAGDGPQREELERISNPSVVEFRGFVRGESRDDLIRNARALVLPSITKEADPLVIAQAVSAGIPCIVSSQTATARLADRSSAIRVYNDASSLVVALEAVESLNLHGEARALYEERWSANSWMRAYESQVLATNVP
jgi:glycosyltransferase involved in cell wall biosynthesis